MTRNAKMIRYIVLCKAIFSGEPVEIKDEVFCRYNNEKELVLLIINDILYKYTIEEFISISYEIEKQVIVKV